MPILEYAIPCQLSSIDERTNAVSLFGILDNLSVVRQPNQAQAGALVSVPIEMVTVWRRNPEDQEDNEFTQVITIVNPGQEEEIISHVDFKITHYRYRIHTQLPPIAILQEGVYKFKISLETDTTVGPTFTAVEYPIPVEITNLPIVIDLTDEELQLLQRPISGEGGFQSILRRIQDQIAGRTLVLNPSDAERLIRYVEKYGSGGFQSRLKRLVEQVKEQLE